MTEAFWALPATELARRVATGEASAVEIRRRRSIALRPSTRS